MDLDEEKLVERACNGDVEAFEQLIEPYHSMVYNLAFHYLKEYHDASEAAQEAFLRAFKAVKTFKKNSTIKTWLYRITINTCLDTIKKKKNEKRLIYINEAKDGSDGSEIELQIPSSDLKPDQILEQKAIQKVIRDEISKLPKDSKTILILRDFNDLSYEEIAKILNISLGTVKSRLSRARNSLKDNLLKYRELFNTNGSQIK